MSRKDSAAGCSRQRLLGKVACWLQIGGLILISHGVNRLMVHWGIPLPGSVVGMLLLLGLLLGKWVRPSWLQHGARTLHSHLGLFFVPAMLGLLAHPEWISAVGLQLLLATLVGTPLVMIGTAAVVELGFRWRSRP